MDWIENPKLILLITSLIGAIGGIGFTAVANPPTDFYYWLPLFALFGIIAANLVLLIIYEIIKGLRV